MNQSLGRALDRSGILDGHCEIVPSDGQGLINHALKAKALLSDSDCGRRFGSVLRHHSAFQEGLPEFKLSLKSGY